MNREISELDTGELRELYDRLHLSGEVEEELRESDRHWADEQIDVFGDSIRTYWDYGAVFRAELNTGRFCDIADCFKNLNHTYGSPLYLDLPLIRLDRYIGAYSDRLPMYSDSACIMEKYIIRLEKHMLEVFSSMVNEIYDCTYSDETLFDVFLSCVDIYIPEKYVDKYGNPTDDPYSDENYSGIECPHCGSSNVSESSEPKFDGAYVVRRFDCDDCYRFFDVTYSPREITVK